MPEGLEGELQAAIESACADLLEVADDSPRESLPVESQLERDLGHTYHETPGMGLAVLAGIFNTLRRRLR